MNYPKILSAKAIDDHTLIIEFDNSKKKKYDVTPLLEIEMFYPLRSIALFKAVQIEKGGYAVFWGSNLDISEYELWSHGQEIS